MYQWQNQQNTNKTNLINTQSSLTNYIICIKFLSDSVTHQNKISTAMTIKINFNLPQDSKQNQQFLTSKLINSLQEVSYDLSN